MAQAGVTRRRWHPRTLAWLLLAFGLALSTAGVALAHVNHGVAQALTPPAVSLIAAYVPATVAVAASVLLVTALFRPLSSRVHAPVEPEHVTNWISS